MLEGCQNGDCRKKKTKRKDLKKEFGIYFISHLFQLRMQTGEQAQLLSYANLVCTPFSLAGAIYMIQSNFKTSTKSFSSRLVICLALSDLLLSICDLVDIF